MPNFRRGREAMEKSASRKGGRGRTFVPDIYWEDGDKKHILMLTPLEEVPTLLMHEVLPVTREKQDGGNFTIWESVISRKDESLSESADPLSDEFDLTAKERCVGAAVELEPIFKVERGRKRAKGFKVKTETFTRRTDDGEEDVEAPVLGLISLYAGYLWPALTANEDTHGPISEIPVEVTRNGTQLDTDYTAVPFVDQPVDFSPMIENIEGIGYLQDDLEAVLAAVEAEDDGLGAAQAIARVLFEKRLDELADEDRYNDIMEHLDESQIRTWDGKGKKATKKERPARPTRSSSRKPKAKKDDEPEPEPEPEPEATEPEAEETTEEEGSVDERFAALKARIGKKD